MGSAPRGHGGPVSGGDERQAPYLSLHAVEIFVRDQERSLRFYLDKLGFKLAFDAHLQSGQRWVAVSPPDGDTVLTLIQAEPESPEYKLIGRNTHVVVVTEDVVGKYREWSKRGVRFRHMPRLRRVRYDRRASENSVGQVAQDDPIWGAVFTRFEDIDRNSFALVSFDETSRAIEAERQARARRVESERRAANELRIAKEVQAHLFPQMQPRLRTLEYAGSCIQARQVGGDYYDFLELGQDRVGLVVGDIAGKGIAAALLMANLQANLRSQCAIALDEPERFLRSVNRLFCENTTDAAYATLFFAEYDDRTGRLRYANCGHLSGLLLRSDDTLERLHSNATMVGIFRDWDCTIDHCMLQAGDTLALYTDGVTECFNDVKEEFGEDRLIETLRRHRGLPINELLTSIVEEVCQFSASEQYDDITVIVAKCKEPETGDQQSLPFRR